MNHSFEKPSLPKMIVSDHCTFQVPSRPDWIDPTVDYLKNRSLLCGACQESRCGKLVIALHEALTNAIVHGNLEISSDLKEKGDDSFAQTLAERSSDPKYAERMVTIETIYDGRSSHWIMTDQGNGFDTQHYLNRTTVDEADLWLSSGRGILLMRSFLDDVRYEANGTRVILTLNQSSGEEKRSHPRYPLHRRVEVAPIRGDGSVNWDAAYAAITQNYSETGLGLIQDHLSAIDRVIIGIETEGRPTMYLPAQIRHCRSVEDGLVELGCQFQISVTPPPHREALAPVEVAVETLLDKFRKQAPDSAERRIHPRETYTERIQVVDKQGGAIPAVARDLSKGGIAFISPAPVPLEKRVILLPQGEGAMLRVNAEIIRCTQIHQGFYDVGARFLAIDEGDS